MTLGVIMLSEMTVTEGKILYDSTYMRYLQKSNSEKVECGYQGPGGEGNGKLVFNGYIST